MRWSPAFERDIAFFLLLQIQTKPNIAQPSTLSILVDIQDIFKSRAEVPSNTVEHNSTHIISTKVDDEDIPDHNVAKRNVSEHDDTEKKVKLPGNKSLSYPSQH